MTDTNLDSFVTRTNEHFLVPEYRAQRGAGWTLHTDKAQRFTFGDAIVEHRLHERSTVVEAFADAIEQLAAAS
jgi:hypothetical protein